MAIGVEEGTAAGATGRRSKSAHAAGRARRQGIWEEAVRRGGPEEHVSYRDVFVVPHLGCGLQGA